MHSLVVCEAGVQHSGMRNAITYSVLQFTTHISEAVMARWAIIFFVIALVAALFGFGGIAGDAAWIGQILLVVFLILAVLSMVFGRGSAARI